MFHEVICDFTTYVGGGGTKFLFFRKIFCVLSYEFEICLMLHSAV